MTKQGFSALALAAAMTLGGSAVAQESSGQSGQQSGSSSSQPGQQGQQSQQQGQQIDQQIQQQMQQMMQQPAQAPDKLFVLHAAINNTFEMQLSQQAMQKAQSQEVKQLAQQITRDHQQAGQQLQQVAQKMQVQVPQGLPSIKQQELQILTSLPAEQFEKQYVAKMNAAHAMDVTAFGQQAQLAQSQELKQFVTQQLPKLQQHQQQVIQTAAAVGVISPDAAQQAGARIRAGSSSGGSSGGSSGAGGSSSGGSSSGGSSSGGSSSGGSSSGGGASGGSSGGASGGSSSGGGQ